MQTANRLNEIHEYYFSAKLQEIEQMNKQGLQVINLGIGSPDLPPHPSVIEELHVQSSKPENHAYQSYRGSAVLRDAIAVWYKKMYNADLDAATEILPLIGSKEGIMHICMTYLNEGDEALIPDPGYPTYTSAVKLAGGKPLYYSLTADKDWEPDLDSLEKQDLRKVKLMWVNYPHMPTGKKASIPLFEKLVAFARKHNILLCHDNPYSFILNDEPLSLLSIEGAKEVALELNSLSKSHNMAGWRVGMLCTHKDHIQNVLRFKSNMDSGMFLPLQLAAAKALALPNSWYESVNEEYGKRRFLVYQLLDILKCEYETTQTGMFVWAKIPAKYEDGFAISDEILHGANVFITPGGIFGASGNGYIRVSLCSKIEALEKAIERINEVLV